MLEIAHEVHRAERRSEALDLRSSARVRLFRSGDDAALTSPKGLART